MPTVSRNLYLFLFFWVFFVFCLFRPLWPILAYLGILWPIVALWWCENTARGKRCKTLQGKQCKTHGRTVHSVLFCLKSGRTGGFCSSFQNDGRRRRSARDISIRHVRMSEVHFVSLFGQGIYKGSCEIQHLQLQVCCPVDIQHLSFSNGHVTKTWTDRY